MTQSGHEHLEVTCYMQHSRENIVVKILSNGVVDCSHIMITCYLIIDTIISNFNSSVNILETRF